MAREGSLEAPTRHPLGWRDPAFTDTEKVNAELRRVFDICHGCRRCFNLCDSFPRLFRLIDESATGELDSVDSSDFASVVDACTLCDMCFMTKCPYVPPHEFNLDFPHLMLRYRVAEATSGKLGWAQRQLTQTDRNGRLGRWVTGLVNWTGKTSNRLTRIAIEAMLGVHRKAVLPSFHWRTFTMYAKKEVPSINCDAPAFGRKAVLYATCFVNYNNPDIGVIARRVLAKNGVETEVVYPSCCGMPQLERGQISEVAGAALRVAAKLRPWIDRGYAVIALVPSCALMLKFEWPLVVPEDDNVRALSVATCDLSEYIVGIAENEGLAPGLRPLHGGVTLHAACHARAQNMGRKAADMLSLIPNTEVTIIERCSGHGGSWGIMKNNFEVALEVGKSVVRQVARSTKGTIASECPLAAEHIAQGMEYLAEGGGTSVVCHPIELMAEAYGLE